MELDKLDKLFSLKDLFIAFLSGVIWLVDLCLVLWSPATITYLATSREQTSAKLSSLALPDSLAGFLVVLLGILLPYIMGLLFLPLSLALAEFLYKVRPYVLEGLTTANDKALDKANERFPVKDLASFKYRLFETYLLHKGSKALTKIEKFSEQTQLYASLLLPLPLFVSLLFWRAGYYLVWPVLLGLVLFIIFFMRYRAIRGHQLFSLTLAFLVAVQEEKDVPKQASVQAMQAMQADNE